MEEKQDIEVLPPLPPSSHKDFWGEAEITSYEVKAFQKCDHYFVLIPDGAQCNKCHFGLLGAIKLRDGLPVIE